jgi:hypothetical protein
VDWSLTDEELESDQRRRSTNEPLESPWVIDRCQLTPGSNREGEGGMEGDRPRTEGEALSDAHRSTPAAGIARTTTQTIATAPPIAASAHPTIAPLLRDCSGEREGEAVWRGD